MTGHSIPVPTHTTSRPNRGVGWIARRCALLMSRQYCFLSEQKAHFNHAAGQVLVLVPARWTEDHTRRGPGRLNKRNI